MATANTNRKQQIGQENVLVIDITQAFDETTTKKK